MIPFINGNNTPSLIFVRTSDSQQIRDALASYYAAAERPGPMEAAAESERRLVVWEDGFEPLPSSPLNLFISPPADG